MRNSILSACCLAMLVAGCGDASPGLTPDDGTQLLLRQVGELYRNYSWAKKKAPEKVADLTTVSSMAKNGFDAVRNGSIVVLFGTKLKDIELEEPPATSDEVLAYAKEVPESGGYVLMTDRHVKRMTADEFKAAPKADRAKVAGAEPAKKK